MRTTHSFSIDFVARKCKGDKKRADIFARITVDGALPKEIGLKEQIDFRDWDNKGEVVTGRTIKVKSINDAIDDMRSKIKEKYRELQREEKLITAETIKYAYLGINESKKGHKLIELLTYYQKIWEDKLAPGNWKNFKTTIQYVTDYLALHYASKDIYLTQLDMEFATNIEHYISNNPLKEFDPCKGNGLKKHMQRFKRMVSWSVELKWLKAHPFKEYSCSVKKTKRKKLTLEEVMKIENHSFINKSLEYVADLFIFSCYSGLAFVDAMALSVADLERAEDGTIWCNIYRTKSGEKCAVPFLQNAQDIIEKYWHSGNALQGGTIFPRITNKHINDGLKVLMEIFGILLNMTFHLARHTFAKTIALKNGVPLETVQMILGHATIRSTQEYADVDEEKIDTDIKAMIPKLAAKKAKINAGQTISDLGRRPIEIQQQAI